MPAARVRSALTISDGSALTAFVHVRHQDQTSTLVGQYRLVVPKAGRSYGEFGYVGSWLRNEHGRAFALDPDHLPLERGLVRTERRARLHGVLADATPDTWGRRLIEAHRTELGPPLQAQQWLLAAGDEKVGCLAFSSTPSPPSRGQGFAMRGDLAAIADGFERLERGESPGGLAEHLWRAGISMGGARPKAVVQHREALWIAKFQRWDDTYDQCAAEHAAMRLAVDCGIRTAETQVLDVGPRRIVIVRRFDRTGRTFEPSCHYLSGLSALGYDETADAGAYYDLAAFLHRHGADPIADRRELFRRMVFNVLCGNRDDHLKNHAFVRGEDGGWRLSPAFDIVPQPDMDPQQAIGVGRSGGYPSLSNCLTRAADFALDADAAKAMVAGIVDAMRPWRQKFESWGVPEDTIHRLGRAFSSELGD